MSTMRVVSVSVIYETELYRRAITNEEKGTVERGGANEGDNNEEVSIQEGFTVYARVRVRVCRRQQGRG